MKKIRGSALISCVTEKNFATGAASCTTTLTKSGNKEPDTHGEADTYDNENSLLRMVSLFHRFFFFLFFVPPFSIEFICRSHLVRGTCIMDGSRVLNPTLFILSSFHVCFQTGASPSSWSPGDFQAQSPLPRSRARKISRPNRGGISQRRKRRNCQLASVRRYLLQGRRYNLLGPGVIILNTLERSECVRKSGRSDSFCSLMPLITLAILERAAPRERL